MSAPIAVLDGPQLVFPFDRPVTAEVWNTIVWPLCPKCGATLQVERLEMTAVDQQVAHYLPGRLACPNEHDPTA